MDGTNVCLLLQKEVTDEEEELEYSFSRSMTKQISKKKTRELDIGWLREYDDNEDRDLFRLKTSPIFKRGNASLENELLVKRRISRAVNKESPEKDLLKNGKTDVTVHTDINTKPVRVHDMDPQKTSGISVPRRGHVNRHDDNLHASNAKISKSKSMNTDNSVSERSVLTPFYCYFLLVFCFFFCPLKTL